MTATATLTPAAAATETLAVVVRLQKHGPEATREPVLESDLADAYSEAWLHGCLRKGRPDVPFEDVSFRLAPIREGDGPACAGFALDTTRPGGLTTRLVFTTDSLAPALVRALKRLLAEERIKADDEYHYEVVAEQRPAADAPAGDGLGIRVTSKNPPLAYLTRPLRPLMESAVAAGETDERCYPVFYTKDALQRAIACSRKGALYEKPVETGGVLVGPLCCCPDTGELFAVITDVLEVRDAEEKEFSLTYTGKSWARIQAVLRARQAQPATRAHRLLGQCHGHNFLPLGGAEPCEHCALAKVCSRTSVFISADDRLWSQAVFSRQPWQLAHIFGLNARKEEVHSLYGLRDGRLQQRGFHVIADFEA